MRASARPAGQPQRTKLRMSEAHHGHGGRNQNGTCPRRMSTQHQSWLPVPPNPVFILHCMIRAQSDVRAVVPVSLTWHWGTVIPQSFIRLSVGGLLGGLQSFAHLHLLISLYSTQGHPKYNRLRVQRCSMRPPGRMTPPIMPIPSERRAWYC